MSKTIFSTWAEIHTFLIGLFEVLCPWPARNKLTGKRRTELLKEYHYYMAGRAAGFPVLLLILVGIAKLIQEALL